MEGSIIKENENGFMDSGFLADSIRSTGYNSADNAIAEIIDNSIEAMAKETFIIVSEGDVNGKNGITQIAFLDNGIGMNEHTLQSCLRLGASDKRESRKGIGRFGVGLTQSSMSICTRVEIYSWQNGVENCKSVYLDLDEVRNKRQTNYYVEDNNIPDEYKKYIHARWPSFNDEEIDFRRNGTLVIWKRCDRNLPRRVSTLFDNLEKNLGKKFRYLIQSKEQRIFVISQYNENLEREILPNDPLFLMKNNLILGDPEKPTDYNLRNGGSFTEPFFEPFIIKDSNEDGEIEVPIEYFDEEEKIKKKSKVIIKFSIVKEKFYSKKYIERKPGQVGVGKKFISKYAGISIVRANREIDFGKFDFADESDYIPEDRWWGCEIRFTPELDEAFGVSNNKQGVILRRIEEDEIELYQLEENEDDVKPIWLQIRNNVEKTIRDMRKRNSNLRDEKAESGSVITDSESTINNNEDDKGIETITGKQKEEMTKEETQEEARRVLKDIKQVENPTEEDIERILLNKVTIGYDSLSSVNFFEVDLSRGICKCIINTDHIFYEKFFEKIKENKEIIEIFEIFLASLARLMDELPLEEERKIKSFVEEWNYKLTRYIKSQYGEE